MLHEWLDWRERNPCPYSQFHVIDAEQRDEPSQMVRIYLIERLQAARFDPHFLRDMANSLGWTGIQQIVEQGVPSLPHTRRGAFGEVLTAEMLTMFHEYKIPVFKLRFQMTANQSLLSPTSWL